MLDFGILFLLRFLLLFILLDFIFFFHRVEGTNTRKASTNCFVRNKSVKKIISQTEKQPSNKQANKTKNRHRRQASVNGTVVADRSGSLFERFLVVGLPPYIKGMKLNK
jgi:hypothetical protein